MKDQAEEMKATTEKSKPNIFGALMTKKEVNSV